LFFFLGKNIFFETGEHSGIETKFLGEFFFTFGGAEFIKLQGFGSRTNDLDGKNGNFGGNRKK
jgi:hypothetical protein